MHSKTIKAAFISSMPVLMGYLTMGMAFGILLATQVRSAGGFTAAVMSFFTISGSMQFAAVDMLRNSDSYSLVLTALLALMINIRYAVYGLPFLRIYRPYPRILRYYLICTLTDETYAIETQDKRHGKDKLIYLFCVAFFDHMYWIIGGILGAVLGKMIPLEWTRGIDFAMVALFIVVLVDLCREKANHIPALTGAGVTSGVLLICLQICPAHINKILLPAMFLVIFLLLAFKNPLSKRLEESK